MSTATATAQAAPAPAAGRINRSSFGLVVMLLIEFVLGTAYNLYGTAPSSGHPVGIFSNGLLATHFTWAILTLIAAIGLLVLAIRSKARTAIITSAVGLLALLMAAGAGSSFTQDGKSGSSLTMAIGTAIALLAYTFNLRLGRKVA